MNTNGNLPAPLGVLGFLGLGFSLLILGVAFFYALFTGKVEFRRRVQQFTLAGVGLYFGIMLVFSLASQRKLLALGEEKYFCEIDCHLAYSVTDVLKTKILGDPSSSIKARTFYVVTIKVRFDETTISRNRGNGPLWPNPRVVCILDDQGRKYDLSAEGQRALELTQKNYTPLTASLRPGESYLTQLVFDLPGEFKNPVLLMREGIWVSHFITGSENSLLHHKTAFQLEP